jgi:RNA polymerase sigma factor (sigma-70 family)
LFGFRFGVVYYANPMSDDATLLRRYAETRSQDAFTELVRRHLDLVYSAAFRRTGGDSHRAADIAQEVFATLARNARKLSRHSVLQAWLHTATRNASLNLVISEQRRKAREFQAVAQWNEPTNNGDSRDWERIKPLLDSAIDSLSRPDRDAVVLRYLERRDFYEIGVALRISSDAARMRTARALEKLRTLLARRGITSTAAALGAMVTDQSLMSAPVGLAPLVVSASVAGGGAGIGIAALLSSTMTTKTTITAVIAAFLAYAAGAHFGLGSRIENAPHAAIENATETSEIASLRKSNANLQSELDRVDGANTQLDANIAQLSAANAALVAAKNTAPARSKNLSIGLTPRELKQTILNNLRQVDAARSQYKLEKGSDPDSVSTLVGDNGYIRRLSTVGGEDYSGLSMGTGQLLTVTTPDGTVVTYDPSGAETTKITEPPTALESAQDMMHAIEPAISHAVGAYRANNQGQNPPNPEALTPYFENPQDVAAFAQAREAMAAARKPSQ